MKAPSKTKAYRSEQYRKNKTKEDQAHLLWLAAHPGYQSFICSKNQSRRKGREFRITLAEWAAFIQLPCFYCGGTSTGLDRKDSSLGYTLDNVVPACRKCNTAKMAMSVEEFIGHCRKIVECHSR